MANTYTNKVIVNGETKIDLTQDSVAADKLLSGYTAHGRDGAPITGTCDYDANTSDATAQAAEILTGKSAYVSGQKVNGSMVDNGSVAGTISTKAGQYTVPQGYHDGGGKVGIASAEQAKIVAGNIKMGVSILGVEGTYSGEAISAQSKTATPTFVPQTIQPDTGYDYLSTVTVNPIPVSEVDNPQGGVTLTIG